MAGEPKKLANLDEEIYEKIGISNLILLAMFSMLNNNKKCSFESLLKECFILFPKAFAFSQYAQWPDSRKLDRPLRTLRKRKLINGDPKTFFSLTKSGEKKVQELVKLFYQKKLI